MGRPLFNNTPAELYEPGETDEEETNEEETDEEETDEKWETDTGCDYPGRPLEFLQPYIDRGILHSFLAQDALREATEALGERQYNYKNDNGVAELSFNPEDGGPPLVFRCYVVASVAPGPQSVLWGHAEFLPHGDDEPVRRMLECAQHDNVPELLADEVKFDEYFANADAITRVIAPRVAIAVAGITGMAPYYSMPTSAAGARMVLILDDINGHLPQHTLTDALVRFPRVFEEQAQGILDWRMAVIGLAKARGWDIHDKEHEVVIEDDGAKVTFTFEGGGESGNGSGRTLSFQAEYKDDVHA